MLSTADTERRYRVVFDRYHRDVYAYFKRRIDADTAKDCTAETFLVAWRRIDKVPDGDEASAGCTGSPATCCATSTARSDGHGISQRV